MHAALRILEFWALAFVSLAVTLVLLNIFWELIEQDLGLKSLGQEAAVAGVASFIEAIGLWLILSFANSPIGMRGMIIPALTVGVIYKFAHVEDWSRYEIIGLLMFQLVIAVIGAALLTAHFALAIGVAMVFGGVLAIIAGFVRGL